MTAPVSNADQIKYWNGVGGKQWLARHDGMEPQLAPLGLAAVEAAAPKPGERVIDIGCGTGTTSLRIADMVGDRGYVLGVDVSEPLVEAARRNAVRRPNVQFLLGDASQHRLEGGFDLLFSRFGVMFFADPVAAFTNLRRAARAGGALRFIAWRSAAENPFMTTAERAAAPLLPALPPRPAGGPGQFALADGARLRAILADSGWTGVDVRALDVPCVMPEAQLVPYLSRLGPVGMALQGADDATRERVLAAVRPAFDSFVHGDEVQFTGACWLATASVTSPTP